MTPENAMKAVNLDHLAKYVLLESVRQAEATIYTTLTAGAGELTGDEVRQALAMALAWRGQDEGLEATVDDAVWDLIHEGVDQRTFALSLYHVTADATVVGLGLLSLLAVAETAYARYCGVQDMDYVAIQSLLDY